MGTSPALRLAAVSGTPMVLPHDLTLTPDERFIAVADMGQNRVVLLDADTLELRHIIGKGVMSFPHDVVFDPDGRLLVADSGNDRVMIYTLNDSKIHLVDVWNGLDSVEGIAVAPDGRIFATLTAEHRIVQLRDGEIVGEVDYALGTALKRPHDIEVTTDKYGINIIVADSGNHRLVVFNDKLAPLFEISTWDPPLSEPKYFSTAEDGTVYIADSYNNRIRVFTDASRQVGEFAADQVKLPEGVYVKGNRVWVSDTEGGRVLLYRRGQKQ